MKAAALALAACLLASPALACTPGAQHYYVNRDGQTVPSPTCGEQQVQGLISGGVPNAGVTAICRDGSASHSRHHIGTCAFHGGVQRWVK